MTTDRPPRLQPNHFTEPFWEACRRGVLEAALCKGCGHLFMPLGPVCPKCWSNELSAQALSGYGEVLSFTVYRQSYHPDFPVPYVIALIALEEGPRLISNVIGCTPEAVAIGVRVKVRFEPRGEFILPLFAPANGSAMSITKD